MSDSAHRRSLPSLAGLGAATLVGAGIAVYPPVAIIAAVGLVLLGLFLLALRWAARTERQDSELAYDRLLLWILVINVPTFLEFDSSGLTHDYGLINAQSLSRIATSLLVGVLFVIGRAAAAGAPIRNRASTVNMGRVFAIPIAMYVWYAIDAPIVSGGTDLLLALFRAAEWLLFLAIAWKVFRRAELCGMDRPEELLLTVLPIVVFPIVANLLVLPVAPSLVYQTSAVTGVSRLGGFFTHPNMLAALTALAIFYMAGKWHGWRRMAGIVLAFAMLVLTYSRSGLVSFLIVLCVYLFVRARSFQSRLLIAISGCLLALLLVYSNSAIDGAKRYLQRGQSEQNLMTLSERTIVWEAAKIMIADSPMLGTGFVAGPKRLAEVMMTFSTGAHFVAPHAHNEILQAQISGGVVAAFLSLLLQLRILYLWWRVWTTINEPIRSIGLACMLLLVVYGILQPTLSGPVSIIGGLFLLLYLWLEYTYQKLFSRDASGVLPARSLARTPAFNQLQG